MATDHRGTPILICAPDPIIGEYYMLNLGLSSRFDAVIMTPTDPHVLLGLTPSAVHVLPGFEDRRPVTAQDRLHVDLACKAVTQLRHASDPPVPLIEVTETEDGWVSEVAG